MNNLSIYEVYLQIYFRSMASKTSYLSLQHAPCIRALPLMIQTAAHYCQHS
jgi:hypothetical protein